MVCSSPSWLSEDSRSNFWDNEVIRKSHHKGQLSYTNTDRSLSDARKRKEEDFLE